LSARLPAALALAAAAGALAAPPPSVEVSDGRYVMGTILAITLETGDRARGRMLLDRLYGTAQRLDRILTLYDPTSDVSQLNARAGRGPQAVDPELAELLAQSIAFARRTRGTFDVSVGPLMALWRAAAERGAVPTAAELARARARVGSDGVRVLSARSVEIMRPGASVDLGGVAKGYALDRLLESLRAAGVASALLDFGESSFWALGAPPGEDGWRLLVRRPDTGYVGVATLRDRAVSVSESLGQSLEIGGRRYGHVIDPRSGRPLERAALAMVLAPSAAEAEALSKALLLLGEEDGLALLESEPGCEGLLVLAGGRQAATRNWQAATRFEPEPSAGLP
jgi:thiamine biosynthesis lipoprotein